jgi:hypothetical protein
LQVYRAFLAYSELGALVAGKPSEMYDALQSILGLDQLIDTEQRLNNARKRFDDLSKQAGHELPSLPDRLRGHPDERAQHAEAALRGRRWDLGVLQTLGCRWRACGQHAQPPCRKVGTRLLNNPSTLNAANTPRQAPSMTARRPAGTAIRGRTLTGDHGGGPFRE